MLQENIPDPDCQVWNAAVNACWLHICGVGDRLRLLSLWSPTAWLTSGSCHPHTGFLSFSLYCCDFFKWSIHWWSHTGRNWDHNPSLTERSQHRQQFCKHCVLCMCCSESLVPGGGKLLTPFTQIFFFCDQLLAGLCYRTYFWTIRTRTVHNKQRRPDKARPSKVRDLLLQLNRLEPRECKDRFAGAVPGAALLAHTTAPLHSGKVRGLVWMLSSKW